MEEPRNVLAAPSHPDPYPWYARLRAQRPVFFDAEVGLWVLSSPESVGEALAHPLLRVRPAAEPVPAALRGRPTGEVFASLVRMNDGAFHAKHRPAVAAHAGRIDARAVAAETEASVRALAGRCAPDALLSAVPVRAIARCLGVPDDELDRTVEQVHDFVRGIAPGADAHALARSDAAVHALMEQGEREGLDRVRAANRIALMQQSLDATAGLIGNAVPRAQAAGAAFDAARIVRDVARQDPAIHNTRRFAADDLAIGGRRIAANGALLLVLADAEAGSPHAFGAGAHGCPGEAIALQLATSALSAFAALDLLDRFGPLRGYRPLPNARIPVFTPGGEP